MGITMRRFVIFILGSIFVFGLSWLFYTLQKNNIVLALIGIYVFFTLLCFFNPFANDAQSTKTRQTNKNLAYENKTTDNEPQLQDIPSFLREGPNTEPSFNEKNSNNEIKNIASIETQTAPNVATIQSMQQNTIETPNLESIANINLDIKKYALGDPHPQIQVMREEQDGFIIQKLTIIEKIKIKPVISNKNINLSNTDIVVLNEKVSPLPSKPLSPILNNEQINNETTSFKIEQDDIDDFKNNSLNTNTYTDYTEQNSFIRSTFLFLRKLAIYSVSIFIIVGISYLGYLYFRQVRTVDEFNKIARSLQPIQLQIEKCIMVEGPNYKKLCNSKKKSVDNIWDLSNSFIEQHKLPSVANITITEGVITVNTNYDHDLKGSTYIIEPIFNKNKGIDWKINPRSTCLKNKFC